MLGRYETQEYSLPVAGMTLRLLGPKYPHALNSDPQARRRFEKDGYKPFWAQPWPAAVMLAEHVIHDVTPGPGPVLEVGAGLGIAGIALTMAGHRVLVTDYDEDALAFVWASARLNGVTLYEVRRLDWREPPPRRFPMSVAADVLWEKRHHAPIAVLLAAGLEPDGTAFLSDPNRSTADIFPGVLQAAGLTCQMFPARSKAIPTFDALDGRVLNGRIYQIWRQRRL